MKWQRGPGGHQPHLRAGQLCHTAELQSLFDDWLREIEQLIGDFITTRNRVDPEKIATHFKLRRESVIFIVSKLTREGRVAMQASSTAPQNKKIRLIQREEP